MLFTLVHVLQGVSPVRYALHETVAVARVHLQQDTGRKEVQGEHGHYGRVHTGRKTPFTLTPIINTDLGFCIKGNQSRLSPFDLLGK